MPDAARGSSGVLPVLVQAGGLRFEEGPSTVQISYPYAGTGGPGFEVAPDGHVRACWHAGRGADVRVTCPAR